MCNTQVSKEVRDELNRFISDINKTYTERTGNRLIIREFNNTWYLCNMVPLGEETITSGTLEKCKDKALELK